MIEIFRSLNSIIVSLQVLERYRTAFSSFLNRIIVFEILKLTHLFMAQIFV